MQTVSRLINTFVPEHYNLSLNLNRTERTFQGMVTIKGEVLGSEELRLHSQDLTITSVTFDGKQASFAAAENDELVITHPDLTIGTHIVVVSFSGVITDTMHGIYPSLFEHDGVKKELLATQFESHHAREAFPCVDEPEAKATFDVTLSTEQGVIVLGNMPVKEQRVEDEQLITLFETTPRMSTYLVAWVVGELHKKSGVTKSGVEVNIWATPAQAPELLDFALDIGVRTIDFFDEFFGVPYPLPKADHVALPDFSSGAMENWGLITYREIALLAHPTTTPIDSKHYIATVIAHELSHQWFGNLVTMKWWNDLWLNESFATLMEYLAVDALEPDWKIWFDFSSYESLVALRRDSLDGVQAVQVDVHHPDEISTLFDGAIVYAKGARLLRMLESYIGKAAFQKGLQTYFQKYAYHNTQANDLWTCLTESSGKDIGLFMNTWISQSGYPVLEVTQNDGTVTLSQEQFFVGPHQPSDKLWPIPLGASDDTLLELLSEREVTLDYTGTSPLQFNTNDSAHFITRYDDQLFAKILADLPNSSPLSRLQLLNEQTLLARAGKISSDSLITILQAYKDETIEPVWDLMAVAIAELKKFVENDQVAEQQLRTFVGTLAEKQFTRLGWVKIDGEPETDTKLRSLIISLMTYSERPEILEQLFTLYDASPIEDLDPEIRGIILSAVVRYQHPTDIVDILIEAQNKTQSSELQNELTSALVSTTSLATVEFLLERMKDSTKVRQQDLFRWFVNLIRSRYGRVAAWTWFRTNWAWLQQTFKGDMHFDDFPSYVGSALVTREQLEEYREFFTPLLSNASLKRNIEIGLAEIEGRVDLIERDTAAVCSALAKL